MLGAYLANSSKSNFDLSTIVSDYLGEVMSADIPNAVYLARLYPLIKKAVEESGQADLLINLEMPLALVLADMEVAGFRIDREGIASYGEQLTAVAEALEAQIYFHAGQEFNINSPKQLGEILFDVLGLPHAKKTKTGYSTNAEILEKLRPAHSIVQDILDYRQVTKLRSTYVEGLLKVADESGRVHLGRKLTCQTKTNIILRQKDMSATSKMFGLVFFHPNNLRGSKAGQRGIGSDLDQTVVSYQLFDLCAFGGRASVAPDDRAANDFVFLIEHDQTVHLTRKTDPHNLTVLGFGGNSLQGFDHGSPPI